MKQQALALAHAAHNTTEKMNVLREYLQAFVLRSLHESAAFDSLSFVGGTALRFLFGLPRFSEDLDFSLESKKNYAPEKWLAKLKRDLEFAQFSAEINWNNKTAVHNGWVRIPGLLKDSGLSGLAAQKISIKIEIDTKPPAGAVTTSTLVNKYFLMALRHHDLASLMSGKIHALNCRKFLKGRDYYDLFWYRTQKPPIAPNLKFLQAAINQTEAKPWRAADWQKFLLKKMTTIHFKDVVHDVESFLERPSDVAFLTREFMTKVLQN